MLNGDYFYHKTTRRILALFEYLFNDIKVKKEQEDDSIKTIRVPCAFSSPHREHKAYVADPSYKPKEGVRVGKITPRMGFELENWMFDQAKKRNSAEKLCHDTEGYTINQLQKVPYDFNVTLSIVFDKMDDLFQIVEQIIPYFDPKLTVSAFINEDLGVADDITIILNSVDPIINYEGSFEENKQMEATLSFTIKGFVYRRTDEGKIIKNIDINLINQIEENITFDESNTETITITEDDV